MLPSEYPELARYPNLKRLLELQVDMQFVDLRTMLRLPLPDSGLEGGCNFAAAATIFNIIGGASSCFFDADIRSSGGRFKEMLNAYYPWAGEPLESAAAVDLLYKFTRNPLTHALGLDARRASGPIISLGKAPLTSEQIDQIEDADAVDRPSFLPPTIEYDSSRGSNVISVMTLYWGLHRMLRALFGDTKQVPRAEALAKALL